MECWLLNYTKDTPTYINAKKSVRTPYLPPQKREALNMLLMNYALSLEMLSRDKIPIYRTSNGVCG